MNRSMGDKLESWSIAARVTKMGDLSVYGYQESHSLLIWKRQVRISKIRRLFNL